MPSDHNGQNLRLHRSRMATKIGIFKDIATTSLALETISILCPPNRHFRGQIYIQQQLCPPNRHFRGQTCIQQQLCPPNRHFRGQTYIQQQLCPPNRHFRGQTYIQQQLCPPTEAERKTQHTEQQQLNKEACSPWHRAKWSTN